MQPYAQCTHLQELAGRIITLITLMNALTCKSWRDAVPSVACCLHLVPATDDSMEADLADPRSIRVFLPDDEEAAVVGAVSRQVTLTLGRGTPKAVAS